LLRLPVSLALFIVDHRSSAERLQLLRCDRGAAKSLVDILRCRLIPLAQDEQLLDDLLHRDSRWKAECFGDECTDTTLTETNRSRYTINERLILAWVQLCRLIPMRLITLSW